MLLCVIFQQKCVFKYGTALDFPVIRDGQFFNILVTEV
jgi:hypothetical protein